MAEPISSQPFPPHAIAIIGLAGRFPGGRNLDDLWLNVRDGVDCLETFSDADLDAAGVPQSLRSNPDFVRKGTTIAGAELFDAGFFGLSPREAQIVDPQHRIFLECAWEALEHAGYAGDVVQRAIGEYVAAHLAGVMALEDVLTVVAARGRLMQALAPGIMAAVHLSAGELGRWLGENVEIAAINAPSLCTVSGPAAGIAELLKRLEASSIEAQVLHTSHAFHSAMMEPALAPFTAVLDRFELAPPRIPCVSNVTGKWITPEQAMSPAYYATHLRCAVQFEAGVRTLAADPTTLFLEVGPGNALAYLASLTLGKERARHIFSSLSRGEPARW